MSEHVVPRKIYYGVFLLLMVLTALTVGAAYINLGMFNPVIALLIAAIKATAVALFFMHIRWETQKIVWVWLIAGVFWLIILLALSMTDYATRGFSGIPGR